MGAGLVACGSGSTSTSSTTSAPAGAGTTTSGSPTTAASTGGITIKSYAFSPASVKAKVGDTVQIHNADPTAHTVTADDKSFDTKDIAASGMATIHVTTAGTFGFHCNIHQFMKGTITVS
jgi:plastocyanin